MLANCDLVLLSSQLKGRCSEHCSLEEGKDPKKTLGADLPQDRRPCLYLSSPMEN